MKKLIAICAVALSMGAFADSYLYWMLAEPSTWSWENSKQPQSYATAKIGVMNNSTGLNVGYLNLYTGGVSIASGSVEATEFGTSGLLANLGSFASSGYSYYIELFNDKSVSVGHSSTLNYASAASYITSSLPSTSALPDSAWSPTAFTTAAIPEPTSGLLMLFGLSALALRRKRQV